MTCITTAHRSRGTGRRPNPPPSMPAVPGVGAKPRPARAPRRRRPRANRRQRERRPHRQQHPRQRVLEERGVEPGVQHQPGEGGGDPRADGRGTGPAEQQPEEGGDEQGQVDQEPERALLGGDRDGDRVRGVGGALARDALVLAELLRVGARPPAVHRTVLEQAPAALDQVEAAARRLVDRLAAAQVHLHRAGEGEHRRGGDRHDAGHRRRRPAAGSSAAPRAPRARPAALRGSTATASEPDRRTAARRRCPRGRRPAGARSTASPPPAARSRWRGSARRCWGRRTGS